MVDDSIVPVADEGGGGAAPGALSLSSEAGLAV
jgi:hypothetical protein